MTPFGFQDLPDMSGRSAVVTGANSGIGRAAARAFAGRHGAAPLADRRGLRAAVRHEPPGSLRADQPAAPRDHRPRRHRLLDRANLLFTTELQRRLTQAGSPVLATAAHPGYAATNLQFHSGRRVNEIVSRIGNRLIAQDEEGGALPTLYAAVADVPPAAFAGPGGFMEQRGAPKLVGRSDADVARRLWDVSEELTGVRFGLGVSTPA
jgi:NAD(P)-dependent dehydrogenase (short-subunit alcohol dehydrogenase family)